LCLTPTYRASNKKKPGASTITWSAFFFSVREEYSQGSSDG
jgi:hypothetical protein